MNKDLETPPETKTTNRGFPLLTFEDHNGRKCSLQKSSLAITDCIWLGCDEIGLKKFDPKNGGWIDIELENNSPDPPYHIANTRMHLTQEKVRLLLPHLQRFAETGELYE